MNDLKDTIGGLAGSILNGYKQASNLCYSLTIQILNGGINNE